MKKIILLLILLTFVVGCAEQIKDSDEGQQLTNPASVYCEEQGGTLRMEENEAGQLGICTLADGTECEEWAYYRNECPNKESQTESEEVEEEESEFASDLEKGLPDTIQNQICKKLPLTNELSPGDRYRCLAVVNNNAEFCELIKADDENDEDAFNEKNVCLAQTKKDISYCKKVTSDLGKRTCYFGLSLLSGDINNCDGITYDTNLKNLCYWSFANALYWEGKADKITTEHCNKLPAGSEDRSSCLAEKEGDVSLCKNNVNCLTLFEQPMSFCTTGQGKALQYCIRDRAMSSKDFSICEQLTGEKRNDCIGDFAGHITMDISTCDKISDIKMRNECYLNVAIQSSDAWLSGLES